MRSVPEEERADLRQPFDAILSTPEGGKPIEEDEERRKAALTLVVNETKRLQEGSEKGVFVCNATSGILTDETCFIETEGFYNLLFAHLLTQFSPDSPDTKEHIAVLLPVIVSSSEAAHLKYRM